ncbi:23S rRNA (uracil(1939)-C(5))-methyltransferase RlmD [Bacteroidota bacterium]
MKKRDKIELDITGYAFEGKGIAKINREMTDKEADKDKKYVVFVNGSYPGDRVVAQIHKVKKSFAEGKTAEVLTASPERTEPKCKHFSVCGGCKSQDLKYDSQLKYKHEQVRDIFERLGGLKDFEMLPIIPSDKVFHYRNKMEFSFAKRWLTEKEIGSDLEIIDKEFALGLHIPRIYDKVVDLDVCYLCSEVFTEILNFTRDFFKQRGTEIYSTNTHTGYLRNLVVKQSHNTKDLMVNLVTSKYDEKLMKEYTDHLLKTVPDVTTVINNINEKKAQVAVGDFEHVFYGEGNIYDSIGEYKFHISANSFFQTNTLQAEKLYGTALEFAELTGDEIVYDLYSGAGTIAIYISKYADKVYAFESVEPAIKDAEINSRLNNIDNVIYRQTDLNKSIISSINNDGFPQPDVIIADPPRGGMNPKTVQDILKLKPRKLVYVSCNPATQVRDIKLLVEGGYKLIKIRPVDMFPHTYHIENVALLKL